MGAISGEELMKMEKMEIPGAHEEKILVLVRLRPLSEKEISAYEVADWECINETTIIYRNSLREGSTFPSAYTFDRVFRGDCSTRKVYDEGAKEIALSAVSGINSSIFAYGQTSSGKTYTMMGITEYTVSDIFDYIHRHEERAFVLKFSAIEIYNESVRDLLSSDNTPLRLLDDPDKGTIVEKATEEILRDWNHLKELLLVCEAQRRVGETLLNEKSSRSHQILRLTIESSAREFLGKENSTTLSATVNFVDLAGSERASQASSAGARLKEGCHINRSLLTLGTVIRKLSKGKHGHINYRDSKLTRLLQPALGGNARTAIICTLSPARSHVEQTRNTLLFACCAKEVATKAQVNIVMSDKALVKHLQRELAKLESELRSPAPASSSCDHTALLRKKDLHIQKMEEEIRELKKQRDLAESRVEDLLKMIGSEQNSRKLDKISHQPNQQVGYAWEDECSISASLGTVDSHPTNGGLRNFKTTQYDDRQSESNLDEPFRHLQNSEDHALSDGNLSSSSFGENLVRSNSCQSVEDIAEDHTNYCKEVKCIGLEESSRQKNCESLTLSNTENEETSAFEDYGYGETTEEMTSTQVNGSRGVNGMPNGFAYSTLEQRPHLVHNTVDSLGSPYPDEPSPMKADMSSSRSLNLTRSRSCRADLMSSSPRSEKAEQIVSTPPNGMERTFTGRPDRLRWKIPPPNYDANSSALSRNDSQSSLESASSDVQSVKTSAGEDVTTICAFVEGLNMAKRQYEKQLTDGQVQEMGLAADGSEKNMKDVGVDPMQEALETSRDWPSEFVRQQRAIFELWQTCNVSLVHRTYFFLLFKGDPADSIYMEVELRRLSFVKEKISQGNHTAQYDQNLTLGSSMKALRRERRVLSKLMHKRFSEEERKRLYKKSGIGVNSKRRRLQLANLLWSNTKDMNHIMESASIVAKLVQFVAQGQALKEMFGLSFTPQHPKRRLFGWKNSRASLL